MILELGIMLLELYLETTLEHHFSGTKLHHKQRVSYKEITCGAVAG